MKIERQHILTFLKEIFIVVAGVLIAVSIRSYTQKIDNEEFIDKVLVAVEKEITESKEEVE